jgi:hypothetical protein
MARRLAGQFLVVWFTFRLSGETLYLRTSNSELFQGRHVAAAMTPREYYQKVSNIDASLIKSEPGAVATGPRPQL